MLLGGLIAADLPFSVALMTMLAGAIGLLDGAMDSGPRVRPVRSSA
jgi:hypothetical protein